jgi:hypothetical protein
LNAVLKASLGLTLVITVLTVAVVLSGLHETHFQLSQLVFVVLAIAANVLAVFWALKQTAAQNGYGRQLGNAALIGLIAGAMLCVVSIVLMTVVFPDYLDEVKAVSLEAVEAGNLPAQWREAQTRAIEGLTPVSQAVQGAVWTFVTSVVSGAIVAIFQRRRA